MIAFHCPGCGKHYQAPDELAGRQFSCKQCQRSMQVPAQTVVTAADLPVAPQPFAPPPLAAAPPPMQPMYAAPAAQPAYQAPAAYAPQMAGGPRFSSSKGPVKAVIGILVLAVIGLGVWWWFFRAPSKQYWYMLPNDPTSIGFLDIDKIRGTKFFTDNEDELKGAVESLPGRQLRLPDVAHIFHVGQSKAPDFVVVRLTATKELKDLVSGADKTDKYKGFEYAVGKDGVRAAKLKSNVYLLCRCEQKDFEALLDRADKNSSPDLKEDVKTVLDAVCGYHEFDVAARSTEGIPEEMRKKISTASGQGTSYGGTMKRKSLSMYESESAAKDAADEEKKRLDKQREKADADEKKTLKDVEVSQSGRTVTTVGSCSYDDLHAMLEKRKNAH